MLPHLFKLIWKKKKRNFLMMLEILVSFLILFAGWGLGLFYLQNYKQTDSMSSDQVWALFCGFDNDSSQIQKQDLIRQKLKSYPEIEALSFSSSNIPFSFNSSNSAFTYKGNRVLCEIMQVEPDMIKVLNFKLLSGKFLKDEDPESKYQAVVINRALKEKFLGGEDAIGQLLEDKPGEKTKKIVGVVENFKFKSDYLEITPCLMTFASDWSRVCLVKVKPGTDINFEAKLTKEIAGLGTGWSLEVQHMDTMRKNQNKLSLVPILILFIIYSFLIFNVALGIFGVLFQSISQRKGEIGVRRAMGATRMDILWQFVGETLVIATFGLALGIFFAIQFPLLHVFDKIKFPWMLSILFAVMSVYLIVILCSILPSKQAAEIFPAVALHED